MDPEMPVLGGREQEIWSKPAGVASQLEELLIFYDPIIFTNKYQFFLCKELEVVVNHCESCS